MDFFKVVECIQFIYLSVIWSKVIWAPLPFKDLNSVFLLTWGGMNSKFIIHSSSFENEGWQWSPLNAESTFHTGLAGTLVSEGSTDTDLVWGPRVTSICWNIHSPSTTKSNYKKESESARKTRTVRLAWKILHDQGSIN